jgi:GNAT superfamily N-acetyltransferase
MTPCGLEVHPLTPQRWLDFQTLFGERGACGGCWCMWWRLKRALFNRQKGDRNKRAMREIVDSGGIPGLLAYAGGKPIGWCSVAPRETFPVLENSRVLKRVDDTPVWSVVCLFVERRWRRKGVSTQLLRAAADYAAARGATVIEGYPVHPRKGTVPDAFAWTGLSSAFSRAGFTEVVRRSPTRPIMRRNLVADAGRKGAKRQSSTA